MAKKHKKKKAAHKKSRKRSAAAKRAYKKSGLYKYNQRKKKHRGGKRKGHKKSKQGYARSKYSGSAVAARARFANLVKRLEGKGYDKKTATALAHRASRISGAMKRGAEKHAAAVKAERTALANLFGGIGAAGHLAAMQQA